MYTRLSIHGFSVTVSSNHEKLSNQIKLDFEHFLGSQFDFSKPHFSIDCHAEVMMPVGLIPSDLKPLYQRQNSITYEKDGIRYNDYYSKVVSIFNYRQSSAKLHGTDLDKLYEVLYLLILSRSGKFLDLKGLHKIHAFSLVKNHRGLICMQPMRGGKSTLFSTILFKEKVEIVSDDTPLINDRGELIAFPLRVSLDTLPEKIALQTDHYFLMKREFYHDKYSVSLRAFEQPIARACHDFLFVEAHRSTYSEPLIVPMNKVKLFRKLFSHMVIGFGLPIIFEYFWETGPIDFLRKAIIFIKRFWCAVKLTLTHKAYDLYMCNDSEKNANALMSLLK